MDRYPGNLSHTGSMTTSDRNETRWRYCITRDALTTATKAWIRLRWKEYAVHKGDYHESGHSTQPTTKFERCFCELLKTCVVALLDQLEVRLWYYRNMRKLAEGKLLLYESLEIREQRAFKGSSSSWSPRDHTILNSRESKLVKSDIRLIVVSMEGMTPNPNAAGFGWQSAIRRNIRQSNGSVDVALPPAVATSNDGCPVLTLTAVTVTSSFDSNWFAKVGNRCRSSGLWRHPWKKNINEGHCSGSKTSRRLNRRVAYLPVASMCWIGKNDSKIVLGKAESSVRLRILICTKKAWECIVLESSILVRKFGNEVQYEQRGETSGSDLGQR